jgi:hypothetical protein
MTAGKVYQQMHANLVAGINCERDGALTKEYVKGKAMMELTITTKKHEDAISEMKILLLTYFWLICL